MTAYDVLVENLRELGYGPSKSADRWGTEVWSRKGCPSVRVPAECSAVAAEKVRVQVDADLASSAFKRPPKAFRARATAAREGQALDNRRRDIEARIAARNRELGGAREHLTADQARHIQLKIEADERELRATKALMTGIPGPRADAGRPKAKHRS